MDGDLKPTSQATQHLYHCTYFKIMYIQNDSQDLIHVLGACEKIFSECVSQNCESQPIVYNHFSILQGVPQKKYASLKSYIFVLTTDKSLNCASFVRQDLNLNIETQFFKIKQKLTEL